MRPLLLPTIATAMALAACASSISPEEAKTSNLTISQFVEERFLRGLLPFRKRKERHAMAAFFTTLSSMRGISPNWVLQAGT